MLGAVACEGLTELTEPPPPANQAPIARCIWDPSTVYWGSTWELDVADCFSDPDGDRLTYRASASNTQVVSVAVSGSTVAIHALEVGTATVTITASDSGGLSATFSIPVEVFANTAYLYCSTQGARGADQYIYISAIVEHLWHEDDTWPDVVEKWLTLFQGWVAHNYGARIVREQNQFCNGGFDLSEMRESLRENIADARAKGWNVVVTTWNG